MPPPPSAQQSANPRVWLLAHGRSIRLDRPRIMAILNITPDSFYDASRVQGVEASVERASKAVAAGADILDIGGESTRPGAAHVTEADQIARVVPVIAAIRRQPGDLGQIPISVDTTRASVAAAAIEAGADAINDVSGATDDPGMLKVAARRTGTGKETGTGEQGGAGLILMHRLAAPADDSYSDQYASAPRYEDVVMDVRDFLRSRAEAALRAGVGTNQILLDPGLGFGKSVEQNLELIRGTGVLCSLGYPVLSGASRKSFVGRCSISEPGSEAGSGAGSGAGFGVGSRAETEIGSGAPVDRLAGSIAFSVAHWMLGASVFRVHDVGEQSQALRAAWAIRPRAEPRRTTSQDRHA